MSRLAGRVALVTGASRGIGKATAEALEREGAFVTRVARTLVEHRGDRRLDLPADLTTEQDVARLLRRLETDQLLPDLLVNNAGSFLIRSLVHTTLFQLREQFESNLVAPFLMLRGLLPRLTSHDSGHVVTIGSVVDHVTLPGNAAYGAAKRGLRLLHETLVAETAGTGLRATLVSPAATDTTLWDTVDQAAVPGLPARSAMLAPGDVAEAVVFAVTRPAGVMVEEIRISARKTQAP